MAAHNTAEKLIAWMPGHQDEVSKFETALVKSLCTCMTARAKSQKTRREKMWSSYHGLRSSISYRDHWKTFLQSCTSEISPIFIQYVGNFVFKELVRIHHPVAESTQSDPIKCLTYEEINALRYAAGYIPRALKKKLSKSRHPLKEDIQLCILDLLDDGDEDDNESQDWLQLIDRGGLTRVNSITFEVFVAMEYELRQHIRQGQMPNLEHIIASISENEDVLFLWCRVGRK